MEFMNASLPEEIAREENLGNYDKALQLIERWLKKDIPSWLKKRLIFEKDRIKILLSSYPYTEEEAIKKGKEVIKSFSEEEFYKLLEEGIVDYIVVNGERKYERRYAYNIGYALSEYKERIARSESIEKDRKLLKERLNSLIKGDKAKEYRVKGRMSLKIEEDVKDEVRVWIPFPKEELQQKDVKLISQSHEKYTLAPSEAPQRTIYFEGKSSEEYFVEFEYTIKEWVNKVEPEKIREAKGSVFLEEQPPHIVFTPYLKKLAYEIVGDEKNPYYKAKKIYDWITLNVNYSYVKPYVIYDNISQFVASNLKGDCGFQALLFITLCRIVGVPARWQSGWYISPFFTSPHDWTLFFAPPYGWLPADLSFGGRYRGNKELRNFYFGNLDGFRMVANSDFMKDFIPSKTHWRSDPCDNQVGEVETMDRNIYNFSYKINVLKFNSIN